MVFPETPHNFVHSPEDGAAGSALSRIRLGESAQLQRPALPYWRRSEILSPFLSVLLKDLPKVIEGRRKLVNTILYADDLVIYGRERFQVQEAPARMNAEIRQLGLSVNTSKTEAMKFRLGGQVARNDTLFIAGTPLRYVNKFPYLGLTIHFKGSCFTPHTEERCRKAMVAMASIEKPQLLAMGTALRLFDIKIAPVATFGIELIWESLTVANLESFNRLKAAFLKRAMRLHSTSRNRLAYLLAGTPLMIAEIRTRLGLPETPAFAACMASWEAKIAEVDPKFFETPSMTDFRLRGSKKTNRHILTRFAVHGFHHKLCSRGETYHEADDNRTCTRCGRGCGTYHACECPLVDSLSRLAGKGD